jgi:glucoamylase
VPIKNRAFSKSNALAVEIVSPDALALVRFGLRRPDDPRIQNTIKVIDALLRVKLPSGPGWYRYNCDGYGEHEDGAPFDGTGLGRPWPLLAGERAHYELAAGRPDVAESLLTVMEHSTGSTRLIPEQVWDGKDIPDRELFSGKASGSACPLVWAHSEYIKLRRSLLEGRVFDQPQQTVERYIAGSSAAAFFNWRFNNKPRAIPVGKKLRILLLEPAMVHWSFDEWQTAYDSDTRDSGCGVEHLDLETATLPVGRRILFTFRWKRRSQWEGRDFAVALE